MLNNIKYLSLCRVFHGIRFKVNEDWESGKIPFFYACIFLYVGRGCGVCLSTKFVSKPGWNDW